MKKEIIQISGEQFNGELFFMVKFTLRVTEPNSGESNQKEGVAYFPEGIAASSDDELIALVEASQDYANLVTQVQSPLWQFATRMVAPGEGPTPPVEMSLTDLKMMWYESVDLQVERISSKFTRFQMGYEEREAAAKAYRDRGYTGDPTTWVTRFADNTGMSYQAATDRILEQASLFRNSLMELENFRMDKYLILQASTEHQAKVAYDTIISGCMAVDRKLT